MIYHCGLLSERPDKDRTLQWVQRGGWDLPGFPPEIRHELRVWLNMPGFRKAFHQYKFMAGHDTVSRHYMADFEELRDEVAKNWLSATREDCVRLSRMRPGTGYVPLISQLAIIDDLKRGLPQADIAREYRVSLGTTQHLTGGRPRYDAPLPSGFELLVQN